MKRYHFRVTVTAEDGSHPRRFYGLDMRAANRAIEYASKQLGRAFCAPVPSEEWLENNFLAGSVVDDYGRMITLEQSWDNCAAAALPVAKPVAVTLTAEQEYEARCDAAEYGCLRSDGFDARAPFPHASDPHWSDPRADFSHF